MYMCRAVRQLAWGEVGSRIGGGNHPSARNSSNRVEKMMKEHPERTEIMRDSTNAVNSAW